MIRILWRVDITDHHDDGMVVAAGGVLMSFESVVSQSTTDDETCSDGGLLSEMQKDIKRLFQQQQTLTDNLQQILHMLQRQQQRMNETDSKSQKFHILLINLS